MYSIVKFSATKTAILNPIVTTAFIFTTTAVDSNTTPHNEQ